MKKKSVLIPYLKANKVDFIQLMEEAGVSLGYLALVDIGTSKVSGKLSKVIDRLAKLAEGTTIKALGSSRIESDA